MQNVKAQQFGLTSLPYPYFGTPSKNIALMNKNDLSGGTYYLMGIQILFNCCKGQKKGN